MKVMRVILYEGTEEKLRDQLSKSLRLGEHDLFVKLRIVEVRAEETMREIAAICFLNQEAKDGQ